MNPWQTLNIAPTDDKKIIKKAYAALIKQYKPDEHPEQFQEIQAAYQMALSMRQWQAQQSIETNEETPQETIITKSQEAKKPFSLQQATETQDEIITNQHDQEQLIENLFKQLHQMAFAPLVVKNKLENWKFIEDYYKIDDLTLKPQVAREVFKKVAEYNIFQAKRNKTLLISSDILKYFNHVFDWLSQWQEYQEYFPEHYFRVTFYYFDTDRKFKNLIESQTSIFKRAWAFFIDYLILAFIVYLLIGFLPIDMNSKEILMAGLFILIRLFYEIMSNDYASFGKKLNNIFIIDEYGNSCSEKTIFLRHFYMNLSLVPSIYYAGPGMFNIHSWYFYWLLTILTINYISWVIGKGLLHDRLTRTLAIDR